MILPGTDKRFGVKLKANGIDLPYSTLNDYQFILYFLCNGIKNKIWVFEKNGSGLNEITVDGTSNNKAYAVINRLFTSTLQQSGKFFLEVKVKMTATSEFIELKAIKGKSDIFIDDFILSASPKAMIS